MNLANTEQFDRWIGRTTESEDEVTQRLVEGYRAKFDPYLAPVGADEAPLGCHWCLATAIAPLSGLGPDGHPAKGLLLPPVPMSQRLWAGGEIETLAPLKIGNRVSRKSTITEIAVKQGHSGPLCFVTVRHEFTTIGGVAIRDRQDIVYREMSPLDSKAASAAPPRPATHSWSLTATPVMLFRYSALTFNGHRIHYDYPYATGVEGFSGLVVHGPLQATLLFNLAALIGGRAPARFRYRSLTPLLGDQFFKVCGLGSDGKIECWTQSPPGHVHMQAEVL